MSAKFVMENGEPQGLILALEGGGDEWVIGRDPELCQLVIADASVSRRHLICRKTQEGITVENLSGTNPVYINDEEIVGEQVLVDGDRVRIGKGTYYFTLGSDGIVVEGLDNLDSAGDVFDDDEEGYDTIYPEEDDDEISLADIRFGMGETSRWSFIVISGPNAGAEFPLETGKNYLIGTDSTLCDIILYDISVSRQHMRIVIGDDDSVTVEDLGSSNGSFFDDIALEKGKPLELEPHTVITLGATAFVVVDNEAEAHTIVSSILPARHGREEEKEEREVQEVVPTIEEPSRDSIETAKPSSRSFIDSFSTKGGKVLLGVITVVIFLVGAGAVALFKSEPVTIEQVDPYKYIREALKEYPEVQYTYNKPSGKLFLLGHVLTSVDKKQVMYNIGTLTFVTDVIDNIIVDELAWDEMNQALQWNPSFRGITMSAPSAGVFVLSGFLSTKAQANDLNEYVGLNFPYLDRLDNRVVVVEDVLNTIDLSLSDNGLGGVTSQFLDGEFVLSGIVSPEKSATLRRLIQEFEAIRGVRTIRNLVVERQGEDAAMVNISDKYTVTGSSQQDGMNVSVVINGRILTRGDTLDGMRIVSLRPSTVFLERNGFKYRIDYNE